MKYLTWIMAVLVIGFFAAILWQDHATSPTTSRLVGKSIPEFLLPNYPDNKMVRTAEHIRTHEKPYRLLNIFASWCQACIAEYPELMALNKEPNLQIYGIAWHDTPDKLEALFKQYGNPYHEVLLDDKGQLVIGLGVTGAPESFFIGPEGKIIRHIRGILTAEDIGAIKDLLEKGK